MGNFLGQATCRSRVRALAILVLATWIGSGTASAEDRLDQFAGGVPEGIQKEWAPSPPMPTLAGGLTFYSDRPTFDAAFPAAVTETFEQGSVSAGASMACPAPLDDSSNNACFGPGDLLAGVQYQDRPGPDGVDGLLLVGDGTFGNSTRVLAANALADSLEILFPEPATAVGMDLMNLPGAPDSISIEVFGAGGALLGSTSSPSSAAGVFWGVSSPDPIARLVLASLINEAEAVDDLSFLVEPTLTFEAQQGSDLCPDNVAQQNGFWEPGEVVDLDVTLRAAAGGFTNVQGTLSATSPEVLVLEGQSGWPDLPDGATGSNVDPLRIALLAPPCGDLVDLELAVTSDQGSFTVTFTQSVGELPSPAVPLAIPDGLVGGVASDLLIDTDVTLTDVQVRVDITHSWVGDLEIRLVSPAATEVVLLNRPGVPGSALGCSNNNVRVTFSDAAGLDPESQCSPSSADPWVTGDVLPVQALSAFDGEQSMGTWRLRVIDHSVGDVGTLVDWELITAPFAGGTCLTCAATSDLALTKTCGPPAVRCALEVTNQGPAVALGVQVTDPIPVPLVWFADGCGAGPPVGSLWTWNVGDLNPGETVVCEMDLTFPPGTTGTVINTASVSSIVSDPFPLNNDAEAVIELGQIVEIPTLDHLGLFLLTLVLAIFALVALQRRSRRRTR